MTAKPRDDGINVHERKPVTMPLAVLLALLASVVTGTLAYAAIGKRIDAAADKAEKAQAATDALEKRARAIENAQERMANDIGWIRRAMEEDRRSRRTP